MKSLLKTIFRAIRRAMRAAARAVRGVGNAVDGFLGGLFAGSYVEEIEDDEPILVEDQAARQETTEAVSRPGAPIRHPADLVARAVDLRSGGQKFDDVFDVSDPAERRLHAYVTALDECGLRAIRHMPRHTLARHLDGGDFCAAGLRSVDRTIAIARAAAEAERSAVERKRPSRTPVTDALSSGARMTLDDLIASRRRRVPA